MAALVVAAWVEGPAKIVFLMLGGGLILYDSFLRGELWWTLGWMTVAVIAFAIDLWLFFLVIALVLVPTLFRFGLLVVKVLLDVRRVSKEHEVLLKSLK
jgi:hypothetical protein